MALPEEIPCDFSYEFQLLFVTSKWLIEIRPVRSSCAFLKDSSAIVGTQGWVYCAQKSLKKIFMLCLPWAGQWGAFSLDRRVWDTSEAHHFLCPCLLCFTPLLPAILFGSSFLSSLFKDSKGSLHIPCLCHASHHTHPDPQPQPLQRMVMQITSTWLLITETI